MEQQNQSPTLISINEPNQKKFSIFEKFSGILYLLISSLLFTSTNFLIKKLDIIILDAILIRSIIQLIISIGYFLYKHYQPFTRNNFNCLMFFYSFVAANGTFCFYFALSYIPLADLTTIRYTQIIWTSILTFLIFRTRITIAIVFACILTLIGVIFVVQPSFIFSNKSLTINNDKKHLFGMFISLICALSLSISIILNKKLIENQIPQSIIIFYFILMSFLMLLIKQTYHWIFAMQNYKLIDYLMQKKFLYAIFLVTIQFIPMILTQKSIKREHPSIISIVQSCDILFTIIFEQLYSTTKLNYRTLIGSILVLTSIFIVGIDKFCQDKKANKKNFI